MTSKFEEETHKILGDLAALLITKNKKYGNSALEPVRIFSKASATEQLLVRLDDKLSRLKTQSILEDEDVLQDLMGYLVLLKMSIKESSESASKAATPSTRKYKLVPAWRNILPANQNYFKLDLEDYSNQVVELQSTPVPGLVQIKHTIITVTKDIFKEV